MNHLNGHSFLYACSLRKKGKGFTALVGVLCLLLLASCAGTDTVDADLDSTTLSIPKWSYLGKINTSFLEEQKVVPEKAYVFPATRIDPKGRLVDRLVHHVTDEGKLIWHSQAPKGGELKLIVENQLKNLGFKIISFDELASSNEDRSVFVFNLYYRSVDASSDNPSSDMDGSWTTYARITAATFNKDLNPASKKEIMSQEIVTLFNRKEMGNSVIKGSFEYLLDYIGINRTWSELIYLL